MSDVENSDMAGRLSGAWHQIARDVPIYLISLGLLAVVWTLQVVYGQPPNIETVARNFRLYFAAILVLGFVHLLVLLIANRPDSPISFVRERYSALATSPAFLARLPLFAMLVVMMPLFSAMKSMIPLFNPYSWDATFIAWDQAIFFGHDAWQVLQPALGFPVVTATLAFLYHTWILLPYVGTIYILFFAAGARVMRQYMLAFFMTWSLIGGLLATFLSSVGPVFLQPLLGNDHFAAQMAYLHAANEQVPIMTLRVQELLVEWHNAKENGLGAGITAMPSMHVAMAFLFWLAMRRISRLLGAFFLGFFVITWISSVHLAYHYAVDGLVAIVAVSAIWWSAGAVLKWWDARLDLRAQPTLRTNTVPAE